MVGIFYSTDLRQVRKVAVQSDTELETAGQGVRLIIQMRGGGTRPACRGAFGSQLIWAQPLKPCPVSEAPVYSHFNKQHDLYLIKAWGKARASVPTLKYFINDVASSVHEDDMSCPLSPESFFPGVVRRKATSQCHGKSPGFESPSEVG